VCKWHATYRWKALNKGYNFVLALVSIRGLNTKLWGLKVTKISTLVILRLPLGSPGTKKAIWMWVSWRSIENIIRGKVVASPKSGPW